MKHFRLLLTLLVLLISCIACKDKTSTDSNNQGIVYQCPMKCEGEKTHGTAGSCTVCKMDLKPVEISVSESIAVDGISDESIFNLTSKWNTEEGDSIELEDLKGKTLVMVMIYTTCKAACPRLVADMRNIEKQIPETFNKNLQYVLISIDPKTDTPTHLKAFAKENLMDATHWTFLQGTETGVREFANVLAVKYKQISPMDFSHSNIISVFNPQGELVHQQQGLGVDNRETIKKIIETVKKQQV
ncbi:SCO family protein [Flagellimonas pacifica]|uniref:Protein SCO1/2 n=1 Tax=Flagellimonas pacifica TaxID=1247520 RepID=A0A285MW92_9FLAO|nr:SCO family protein [Allomuricauda parva]SNZ01454.1 protein SCO1/2 [Allomuricauda parva]